MVTFPADPTSSVERNELFNTRLSTFVRTFPRGAVCVLVSRTIGLAYNTVVSIVRAASQRAQLVHNAEVQAVDTTEVSASELWSFVSKNQSNA